MLLMYIQYCQTVGNMKHYIIVSVLVLILFNVMYFALNKKKDLWEFADFFCYVLMLSLIHISGCAKEIVAKMKEAGVILTGDVYKRQLLR